MGSFEETLLQNEAATDLRGHPIENIFVEFVWNGIMEKYMSANEAATALIGHLS